MPQFSIINNQTGKVANTVYCSEDEIAANTPIGHRHTPGAFNSELMYFGFDGIPVAKEPKPSEFHNFDYITKQWVANPEMAWAAVKSQRTRLLADSDWRVTKAMESGQSMPAEWVDYRQALRDITLQADPWSIAWPVAP